MSLSKRKERKRSTESGSQGSREIFKMDLERLKDEFRRQEVLNLKAFPLTEEICLELFKCNDDKNCDLLSISYLNICANPPPCARDEQLHTTNSRQWCKGRAIKSKNAHYGTVKFDQSIERARKIYSQVVQEKQEKLSKLSKKERMKGQEALAFVESQFPSVPKSIPNISDLLEKCPSVPKSSNRKLDKYVKQVDTLLIERTKKEAEKEILESVRDMMKEMTSKFSQDKQNERTEEDRQLTKQMFNLVQNLSARMEGIDNDNKEMKKQMEYIERSARSQLGEQLWSEKIRELLKSGRYTMFKTIILSPWTFLKIFWFRPAWDGFNYFFGNWAYRLYCLAMLLFTVGVFITCGLYARKHYPEFVEQIELIATMLWGMLVRSGSLVAYQLKPYMGEGFFIMVDGAKSVASSVAYGMLNMLIEFFKMVFRSVSGGWLFGG